MCSYTIEFANTIPELLKGTEPVIEVRAKRHYIRYLFIGKVHDENCPLP